MDKLTCTNQSDVLKLVLNKFDCLENFEKLLKQPVDEYYEMVNFTNQPVHLCIDLDTTWINYPSFKRMVSISKFCAYLQSELEYILQCEPNLSRYEIQELITRSLTAKEILNLP